MDRKKVGQDERPEENISDVPFSCSLKRKESVQKNKKKEKCRGEGALAYSLGKNTSKRPKKDAKKRGCRTKRSKGEVWLQKTGMKK